MSQQTQAAKGVAKGGAKKGGAKGGAIGGANAKGTKGKKGAQAAEVPKQGESSQAAPVSPRSARCVICTIDTKEDIPYLYPTQPNAAIKMCGGCSRADRSASFDKVSPGFTALCEFGNVPESIRLPMLACAKADALQEECNFVAQQAAKALKHGIDFNDPSAQAAVKKAVYAGLRPIHKLALCTKARDVFTIYLEDYLQRHNKMDMAKSYKVSCIKKTSKTPYKPNTVLLTEGPDRLVFHATFVKSAPGLRNSDSWEYACYVHAIMKDEQSRATPSTPGPSYLTQIRKTAYDVIKKRMEMLLAPFSTAQDDRSTTA
jgi:hypothetical protein